MKPTSVPLKYWVLGFTLVAPMISWLLIDGRVLEFSINDYTIHEHWSKYYKGAIYRTAILGYCAVGALLASLMLVYRDWVEENWSLLLNLMILAGLVASAVFSFKSELTKDEWEHVHSAWNVHKGMRPYSDFFQHHHGLLWYLLAPCITMLENHSSILLFARSISLVFWMVTLVVVYRTALLLTGNKIPSKFAVLLLLTFSLCTTTSLEFRPDVPQVAFGMLAFYFFICFRQQGQLSSMFVSGICMGVSFLFLQKALFFLFPFGTYQLYLAFTRRITWTSVAVFTGSCFIPVLPFAAIYIASGQIGEYLYFNWIQNINKTSPSLEGNWYLLIPDSLLSPFFPMLFVASLFFLLRRHKTIPIDLVATALIALVLVLFAFTPAWPYRQYFLPVWPVAAIFVGYFLNWYFGHHRKYLQAVVALYVVGISFGTLCLVAFTMSNQNTSYAVDYLQRNNVTENYAVDGHLRHNVFAKDMHFFWYGVGFNYSTYKELINREPYSSWVREHHDDYDFCHLVATKRPKYIFRYMPVTQDFFRCASEIIDRYEPGPWEGLYQIKDEHAIPSG